MINCYNNREIATEITLVNATRKPLNNWTYIADGEYRRKIVIMTEQGIKEAEEYLHRYKRGDCAGIVMDGVDITDELLSLRS